MGVQTTLRSGDQPVQPSAVCATNLNGVLDSGGDHATDAEAPVVARENKIRIVEVGSKS